MSTVDDRLAAISGPGLDRVTAATLRQQPPAAVSRPDDTPQVFTTGAVDATAALPGEVTLLRVTRSGGDMYRLDLHIDGGQRSSPEGDQDAPAQVRPPFDFAKMVRPAENSTAETRRAVAERAFDDLLEYWIGLKWLRTALLPLVERTGATLVVWDSTGFHIPWEMLYEQSAQRSKRWLGAQLQIVRWADLYDATRDDGADGRLPARANECRGGVLSMEALGGTAPAVGASLNGYRVGVPADDMRAALRQLAEDAPPLDLGLLLVRCHGDSERQRLGELPRARFYEADMSQLRQRSALVFLNACSSGVPRPGTGNPALSFSFADIFLSNGASGVIATTADVQIGESHEIAVLLLYEARRGPLNIAEFLSGYRKAAVDRFPLYDEARSAEDYERLFVSFAFVYFGHPGTSLALTVAS